MLLLQIPRTGVFIVYVAVTVSCTAVVRQIYAEYAALLSLPEVRQRKSGAKDNFTLCYCQY